MYRYVRVEYDSYMYVGMSMSTNDGFFVFVLALSCSQNLALNIS